MNYIYKDELYHHGIKGQKWGIRRYQNEDGSYTEAGLKRRNKYDRLIAKYENKSKNAKYNFTRKEWDRLARLYKEEPTREAFNAAYYSSDAYVNNKLKASKMIMKSVEAGKSGKKYTSLYYEMRGLAAANKVEKNRSIMNTAIHSIDREIARNGENFVISALSKAAYDKSVQTVPSGGYLVTYHDLDSYKKGLDKAAYLVNQAHNLDVNKKGVWDKKERG
jgi:hypothetical protein